MRLTGSPPQDSRFRNALAWLGGERINPADVTIIVLNWNRAEETLICLQSLREADLGGARVLVVDNGSGDESVEQIRERFPDQQILPLPQNHGYAGGNNAGTRMALDAGAKAVINSVILKPRTQKFGESKKVREYAASGYFRTRTWTLNYERIR